MPKKIIVETMTPEDHDLFDAFQEEAPTQDLLTRARAFATVAHNGQMRKDGKNPYIVHPERVVKLLQSVGVKDQEVLAAAYLHDVLEDTKADLDDFPPRVQKLVKELTKPSGVTDKNAYIAAFGEKSRDAVLIKLADRYDNLLDGSTTMKPAWVVNYLKGAEALLGAARKAGINQTGPGAKLYAKLSDLKDQLTTQASA